VRILGSGSEDSRTLTQEGMVMGTLDYMAPEQAMDAHHVDTRADLYSLGCTFYYLLSGKPPFSGKSAMEKLLKHREQPPRPIGELRPDVPAGVAAVVHKLMSKNPQDRYQTPAELANALEGVQKPPTAVILPAIPLEAVEESQSGVDWGELSRGSNSDSQSRTPGSATDIAAPNWMLWVMIGILVVAGLTVAGLLALLT
jgi:serine/threonine protein kinase